MGPSDGKPRNSFNRVHRCFCGVSLSDLSSQSWQSLALCLWSWLDGTKFLAPKLPRLLKGDSWLLSRSLAISGLCHCLEGGFLPTISGANICPLRKPKRNPIVDVCLSYGKRCGPFAQCRGLPFISHAIVKAITT